MKCAFCGRDFDNPRFRPCCRIKCKTAYNQDRKVNPTELKPSLVIRFAGESFRQFHPDTDE